VFGTNWRWNAAKKLLSLGLAVVLGFTLVSCGGGAPSGSSTRERGALKAIAGRLSEAAPPEVIQELKRDLEQYQPQVKILSPRPDEVLQDNQVSIRFQVQDLPLFKDETLGLGPHLHVILDNQPYEAVYDVSEPFVLSDLAPGTHTLRVFASRPWHESFKNEGAYAQLSFHIFTRTPNNQVDPAQPLLTYSRPKGSYGAEPILLDFYLANAPLHLIAQERADDAILDWRIRATVNGESFVFDRWEPVYLKGFKPGKNWVQLELLDETGNLFPNPYNNTVRIITYEPNGTDTLAKLTRGELSAAAARSIVDPNYKPDIVPEPPAEPETLPTPEPAPSPTVTPLPEPTPAPVLIPSEPTPTPEETPLSEPSEVEPAVPDIEDSEPGIEAAPIPEIQDEPQVEPTPKRGLFDRFRRSKPPVVEPSPVPPAPVEELPAPEAETTDEETPVIEEPIAVPSPEPDQVAPGEPELTQPEPSKPAAKLGLFDRFRRRFNAPKVEPVPAPAPEAIEPSIEPGEEVPPQLESPIEEPAPAPATSEPSPAPEVALPDEPALTPAPKSGLFDRFRRRFNLPSAEPAPTPEAIEPPIEETQPEPSSELPEEAVGTELDIEPLPEATPNEPTPSVSPNKPGLFDRLKQRAVPPEASGTTGIIELPVSSPKPAIEEVQPQPEISTEDNLNGEALPAEAASESLSEPEPTVLPSPNPNPKKGLIDFFQRRTPKPSVQPQSEQPLPDVLAAPDAEVTVPDSKPSETLIREVSPSIAPDASSEFGSSEGDRFPRSLSPEPLTPEETLPEIIEAPAQP
jgi:hypothetical protein